MKKFMLMLALICFPLMASAVSPELDKEMANSLKIVNGSVQSFVEGLKEVKNFTMAQAPDVAKEYLEWKFYQNLLQASLGIGFFILCLSIMLFISYRVSYHRMDSTALVFWVFMFIPLLIMIPTMDCIMQCVQIKVAPKIYLIQHLVELVKTGHS